MDYDDAYSNAKYIPQSDAYPDRWAALAEAFRKSLGPRARLGLPFGEGAREKFDLFMPSGNPHGLVIFIHGGYWKSFSREWWSHLAAGPLAREWAVAMPSYDLCPTVHISDITQQIARAVPAAAMLTDGPVSITGHSAGGHLTARMAAPGMLPPEIARRVIHFAPISGLSDLEPLTKTAMQADLRITDEEVQSESPRHQPAPAAPASVWVGGDERPSFLDQSRWLAEAWGCPEIILPGLHHFDVCDVLQDPDSRLVRVLTGGE
jgi:acetyl esterase/lipase